MDVTIDVMKKIIFYLFHLVDDSIYREHDHYDDYDHYYDDNNKNNTYNNGDSDHNDHINTW